MKSFFLNAILSFVVLALLLLCFDFGGWQLGLVVTLLFSIFYQLLQVNHHLKLLLDELVKPSD